MLQDKPQIGSLLTFNLNSSLLQIYMPLNIATKYFGCLANAQPNMLNSQVD